MSVEETTLTTEIPRLRRAGLAVELGVIFLGAPGFFFFHGTRWNVHLALWLIAGYALILLRRSDGFSWHDLWHGRGWPVAQRKIAVLRFLVATAGIIFLARMIAPERLFAFPMQRPWFWLLVMFLYPILSVVPQELIFRSFFFRRYAPLFPDPMLCGGVSAMLFGLIHVVFHNPVAPILSGLAGVVFSFSYLQHRSLKWAAIEHAAYGCMVFTVGIGFYFLIGGARI